MLDAPTTQMSLLQQFLATRRTTLPLDTCRQNYNAIFRSSFVLEVPVVDAGEIETSLTRVRDDVSSQVFRFSLCHERIIVSYKYLRRLTTPTTVCVLSTLPSIVPPREMSSQPSMMKQ